MIKNLFTITTIAACAIFWTKTLHARFSTIDTGSVKGPVVIELFTSQSCSSCPPADQLLGKIAENPNVIPLAFHVTYWNHLHWEDTLSREFSSDRQRNYSAAMKSRSVYTPQMIVNGKAEFVGSHASKLQDALTSAKTLAPISIKPMGDNAIEIILPEMPSDNYLNYTLTLFGTQNAETVMMKRGENRGKTVTYTNPVTHIQPLGSWIGAPSKRVISLPPSMDIDNVIVLAQAGNHGEILAAGQAKQ